MKESRKETGQSGENRAADYLKRHGFVILNRNWRTRTGEIDIIARKEETVVFVEVKTLPAGNGRILEQVLNVRKQKRIIKTAKCFLSNNRQYNNCYIRFDVVVVDMPGLDSVYHIENAFSEHI
ncbi:MAG: YraN family protein [Treponema sp.]|nr:YraN family protein [Treponema sp.]